MAATRRLHARTAPATATNQLYCVPLPPALVQRLDRYLRWQKQLAPLGTSVHRGRAEAVCWLLHWAISTIENAHEDRVTARDLESLFAQPPSRRRAPNKRR